MGSAIDSCRRIARGGLGRACCFSLVPINVFTMKIRARVKADDDDGANRLANKERISMYKYRGDVGSPSRFLVRAFVERVVERFDEVMRLRSAMAAFELRRVVTEIDQTILN